MRSSRAHPKPLTIALILIGSGCVSLLGGMRNDVPSLSKLTPQAEGINHFIKAVMLEHNGKFDEATVEMREAAKVAPNSPFLTLRLCSAYVRARDYESALTWAERAVIQNPDNAKLWILSGEIYHQLERFDEAVEAFGKAIELDAGNVMGYQGLVSVEERVNDLVAAIDIYQRLAKLTPRAWGVHYQLGLCLARINDAEGARISLERALELNPSFVRARYLLGVLHIEAGEAGDAVAHLARYLKDVPNDARAIEYLAAAHARLGRYDKAAAGLLRILEGPETEPRHYIEAMYVLLRAGRYEEAEDTLPPDGAPVLGSLLRALVRKQKGDPYMPVLESLDAIGGDIDAECNSIFNELIYLFGSEDTGDFFLSNLAEARGTGLRSKMVEIAYARILMLLERDEEAEPVLLAALDRFGPDALFHYYLATIYEGLERVEDTERHLKEYLAIKPDDPDVLNFLGYLYAEHNMKLDEAEELLKRALDLDPENGFYLDSLGWVFYQKGEADRAIRLIRRSLVAMDSDDAEVRDHLGDAYLLKGEVQKAVAEWERAHRLDPKREGIVEKLKQHRQ